jgi:hypothetical protein
VNSKTIPAKHALPFPVGEKRGEAPNTEANADLQEVSCVGMDRALGIQKASLAAAFRLQTDMIDSFKSASWCTPELSEWLDGMAHAFATCLELQMTLFAMMGTQVSDSIASLPGMNGRMAAEVVERSMDRALGPRKEE